MLLYIVGPGFIPLPRDGFRSFGAQRKTFFAGCSPPGGPLLIRKSSSGEIPGSGIAMPTLFWGDFKPTRPRGGQHGGLSSGNALLAMLPPMTPQCGAPPGGGPGVVKLP